MFGLHPNDNCSIQLGSTNCAYSSTEEHWATNSGIAVRIRISVPCTYRTMEVQQTSNLRIIVRLYVGVQNVSEAHAGEQPTVNRKEVSSNLT